MSRELKRVPLNFDWELEKVWEGYINPHWKKAVPCGRCRETGYSPEAYRWYEMWYGKTGEFSPDMTGSTPYRPDDPFIRNLISVKVNRNPQDWEELYHIKDIDEIIRYESVRMCSICNKSWSNHLSQADVDALWEEGRLSNSFSEKPSTVEVNRWSLSGMGHDSVNQWICLKARAKRMGFDEYCSNCEGEGYSWETPDDEILYENWEKEEPPKGDGWQLWETVSEGSPMSPVFESAELLVEYLVREGYSREAAEKFVEFGYAPSGIMVAGRVYKDIESAVLK